MRSHRKQTCIAVAGVVAVFAACAAPTSDNTSTSSGNATVVSHGGVVRDNVSLVDRLRREGLTVEPIGTIVRPFLRPRGTQLRLSGSGLTSSVVLESYNYDSTDLQTNAATAAVQDAARVAPDGSPKTGPRDWQGPAHFFRADRVVVLYVGSDRGVLSLLTHLLGSQFAGA
jgi:hypothetical protein